MDIHALREKLDNAQHIYLYGAGLTGINYLQRFRRELPSRPIEGIVVSEKSGNPEKLGSLNVLPLSGLSVPGDSAFFWITAGQKHREGIIRKLEEAGYDRYAVPEPEILEKIYMLEKYSFTDRRRSGGKVLFVLAGYKEFLWDDVFERLEKYIPDDVEVCILSSGLRSDRLAEIAGEKGWSYLHTSCNSVTMIQNIAMEYYREYQWFYKMDEDIFLTEGTLESMMRTFVLAQDQGPCSVGVVAPLIPLNGYGYIRILDKLGMRSRYEEKFDKVLSGGYPDKKIESDIEAAAFMWGATGELPGLDELNRRFHNSQEYSFCNVRFSIGCILYDREFWDKMGGRYPYGTGRPGDVGEDEVHMCARTVLKSQALVVDESSVAGHFSFGPQTEGMKDYYAARHELFEIR
ncbi:MAG: hypothetical protein NC392_05910 [Roseburia sp.]|nr:hypothetical protein [Roseburia sp.]MCM1201635.1 hypothetical protein [Bacteroides fragilis]